MEYKTETYNDRELLLDTRKQVLFFFGFLAICGCFFVAGYFLGKGSAQQPPTNYADAGAPGNLRTKDSPVGETYSRTNDIISEPVLPPNAIIEKSPAPPAIATAVSGDAPAEGFIPPASIDTPKPQAKENIPNKAAAAVAEKSNPSPKQATAGKATSPAKQTASANAAFSVQVAAFRVRREAEIKAKELEAKGFEYRIETPQTSDDYYRIRVGNFATRAEAATMANRLKGSGFDTMITQNKGN